MAQHGRARAVPAKFDVATLVNSRSTRRIRVHRSATLTPADITDHDGLPITTVARTLIDLASTLPPHRLERVVHRAEHLSLLDTRSLRPRHRPPHEGPAQRARDTPTPRPPQSPATKSTSWPEHRLVVETDGAGTHATPTAFEDDRRRDAELMTLGYRVVRFTRRHVVEHPRATLATLVLLLAEDG